MKYKVMGRHNRNWIMLKLENGLFGVVDTGKMEKKCISNSTWELLRGGGTLKREIPREMYEKVIKIMEDDTTDFLDFSTPFGRLFDDLRLDDMEIIIVD